MIVNKGNEQVYFIAETKNTGGNTVDLQELSESEQLKITCAKALFKNSEINYKVVKKVNELN